MSEHALPYSNENFQHRHIVIYEHAGMANETASYFIRTLLSENRISYETVEKTGEGIQARVIEKLGPTGLITTTTSAALHAENETRLLSLGVIDTSAQTAAVMKALGNRAASGNSPDGDWAAWHALQQWLAAGERRVIVPFAVALAERIPPVAVRLRRDFSTLLALIAAHALLHRSTRAADQQGRIIATPADYAAVHDLVAKLFAEGIEATVPPIVRATVEAVGEVTVGERGVGEAAEVSLTLLAKKLGLDKNSAHHRVRKAISRGYLVNREEKRGKPARIAIADPLPDELEILPDPTVLECWSEDGGVKGKGGDAIETEESAVATPSLLPPGSLSNTPTPTSNSGGNGQGQPGAVFAKVKVLQEPPPGVSTVTVREIWPPKLGPPGDDIFDL
jgi:hypothetical protein